MNVIFLDIDGVIQSPRYCVAMDESGLLSAFEPAAMHMLRRLVIEAKARIVITSTWRRGTDDRQFRQIFRCCGFKDIAASIHTDWCTPTINGLTRGHEIADWLSKHEVENYLILDDIDAMLPEQKDHFVHTCPNNGILLEHYDRAREILGLEPL